MLSKSQEAWVQYSAYLTTLASLKTNIWDVKNDVDRARQVLLKFNTRILETRAASNVVTTTQDSGKFLVTDDWQPLGLGWVPIGKVCKERNIEKLEGADQEIADFHLSVYKELITNAVQECLKPSVAVIDSLEDSIQRWNSRLPVVPKNLEGEERRAVPVKEVVNSGNSNLAKDGQKSQFWGKKTSHALTYTNAFGESAESDWSPLCKAPTKCSKIKVKLHPVLFEGDPTQGLPSIRNAGGEVVERQRGIRRCVYVRIEDDHEPKVLRPSADLGKGETECIHDLIDTKEADGLRL
ncbi:hypothetical protein LTS08_007867 [Lithohypha guttulata]|nr:hypothetical protein LTS08_007867 [Lithohypha guttulata]